MESFLIDKNLSFYYRMKKRIGKKANFLIANTIERGILLFGRESIPNGRLSIGKKVKRLKLLVGIRMAILIWKLRVHIRWMKWTHSAGASSGSGSFCVPYCKYGLSHPTWIDSLHWTEVDLSTGRSFALPNDKLKSNSGTEKRMPGMELGGWITIIFLYLFIIASIIYLLLSWS